MHFWCGRAFHMYFLFCLLLFFSATLWKLGCGWSLVVQLYVHLNMGLYYQSSVATIFIYSQIPVTIIFVSTFMSSVFLHFIVTDQCIGRSPKTEEKCYETNWNGSGCNFLLVCFSFLFSFFMLFSTLSLILPFVSFCLACFDVLKLVPPQLFLQAGEKLLMSLCSQVS